LNLKNPQTFNEKLQWLKLYDRKKEYPLYVDKFEVKKYVADKLGEEYVVKNYGVWETVEDIDFDSLPKQFVLKCTHDSGSVIVCRDKDNFDVEGAKKKLKKKLETNLYWCGREWPYKDLKPRIIAEQYMEDAELSELRDYKFFCCNGTVKCYKIDFDRFVDHRANYYTPDCKLLLFGEVVCPPDFERFIEPPKLLNHMISFAELLSAGIPFLRVDFYEVGGKIYFGEMTFFPAAGFGKFVPDEWDKKIGDWISLPNI
jgi:hypothetical protein